MENNHIPILLPLFKLKIAGCLELDQLKYGGEITNEMKKVASLFDGNRTLGDIKKKGTNKEVIKSLIDKNFAVLLPPQKNLKIREKWCVISPHPDDAALSLGGTLSERKDSIEVSIFTIASTSRCAGPDPLKGKIKEVSKLRKEEDNLYANYVNANIEFADIEDAELYVDKEGNCWSERLMNHPDEERIELFKNAMQKYFSNKFFDIIYCPLAVGAHCDHATTYLALKSIFPLNDLKAKQPKIIFYEDLPYCQFEREKLDERLFELKGSISPINKEINLKKKLVGISIYRSQYTIDEIFPPIKEYTQYLSDKVDRNNIERLWKLNEI